MKFLGQILVAALLAYAGSAFYMLKGNPELVFAAKLASEQQRQTKATESVNTGRVVFVGGSSCSFSVVPELLQEEFGVSAVNWGYNAGAGRGVHLDIALNTVREGDVLVLNFETSGWSDEEDGYITPLGSQLWYSSLRPHFGGSRLDELGIEARYEPLSLRPGGKHLVSLGAKLALGKPLFRYAEETLQPGGYLKGNAEGWQLSPQSGVVRYELSPAREELLEKLIEVMKERGVTVVATIPWHYCGDRIADEQREVNRQLGARLQKYCPVIGTERWGVETDRDLFADTHWHLSEEGAKIRTRILGRALSTYGPLR